MRDAEKVLAILNRKSTNDREYIFENLYRNLNNSSFYLRAYSKIYSNEGNMTAGTDGKSIDGFGMKVINELIEEIKTEKYKPNPVRRTYIPKKNGNLRPLGIPSIKDKIIQDIVRQILETIYEPIFMNSSHGFRPNRSCHTALYAIKRTCIGSTWCIEGDIKSFFDNIDHDKLIEIIGKKIHDGRFINLISKFLKLGYLENKIKYNTYSGTPQGGIISPILANIYLHEFDKFMEELMKKYNKGKVRKQNPQYMKLYWKRRWAIEKGRKDVAENLLKEMQTLPAYDPFDNEYIRVKYIRYADDFVIFTNASKDITIKIRDEVQEFIQKTLKLELNLDKTLITHLRDNKVKFLGYEIAKVQDNTLLSKDKNGLKKRHSNGKIILLIPSDTINEKIKPFSEKGKPKSCPARINNSVFEIIMQYNNEMRGLYNYYCLASDVGDKLNKFQYYHYMSLVKTIANKEKISTTKAVEKYGIDVPRRYKTGTKKRIGIKYETKTGVNTIVYFDEPLIKRNTPNNNVSDVIQRSYFKGNDVIKRLTAGECELCGIKSNNPLDFEVHHVRKLKDIKDKYKNKGTSVPKWVLNMVRKRRKTLIVCKSCHKKIHNGTYDNKRI